MRKLTKVTASILSAAMLMGALAGCGAQQQVSNETPAKTETEVVASTEVVEPVEMTQITIWSKDAHDQGIMQDLVREFNNTTGKEKGIEIIYEIKGGDGYTQAIDLALKSGEGPDLFTGGLPANYADAGYIIPYEELPSGTELIEEYANIIPQNWIVDEKVYCLPIGCTTQGLIYNKDMFVAAGLVDENGEATPPKTWDELREYAELLTNEAERKYGIILPVKWGSAWIDSDLRNPVMSSAGYMGYDATTGTYDFSGYKEPMEALLGMKEDGSVYPGADSMDNDSARALFAEGVVGMKFSFSFDVGVYNEQFPATCEWGVAPYPTVSEDEMYANRMSLNRSYYINSTTEVDLAKIEEVIRFILSDEVVIARYQEGSLLPVQWDVVENVEINDNLKGWKEFAEIAKISEPQKTALSVDLGGERKEQEVWLDVYAGNTSVDDAIEELNERYNRAIETYYKAHPDKKEADYAKYVGEDLAPTKVEWEW